MIKSGGGDVLVPMPMLVSADECNRWSADDSEEKRGGCRLNRGGVPVGYERVV